MNEPRDILEALFVGDDVENASLVAAAHAAADDGEVRALFDELALVDREVGGDFEARVGEAWFLDSLDTMLAEEQDSGQQDELPDNVVQLSTWQSRIPVALAAAAAIALAFVTLGGQELQPDEFQSRSVVSPKKHDYDMPTVEVFCVKRTDAGVEFVGSEQSELATVQCGVDEEIKLAVKNPDERLRYAAFFGVADDNSLHWYGPSPAVTGAVSVPTSTELRPIGETIRLDVNHEPGTVRVIGMFAETPLDFAEVDEWTKTRVNELRDGQPEFERGVVVRQTFEVTP